jgi:hypothetical protein
VLILSSFPRRLRGITPRRRSAQPPGVGVRYPIQRRIGW